MIFKRIREEIDSFMARDPAARSRLEVLLVYPGLHALLIYRLAHRLWRRGWRLGARSLSHFGKLLTGIEIHPGASIGKRFFIDHGSGVVIGETSEIGDDVTLYQGVTLGGIAPSIDSAAQRDRKRHPTIEDRVIVGSGAQILGPIVVGEGARIGANAVVSANVPPGVTAVGIPAHVIMPRDHDEMQGFMPYGTPANGCPDPVLQDVDYLRRLVADLMDRVDQLEDRLEAYQPDHGDSHEESLKSKPSKKPAVAFSRTAT